jgi:hypothetical protein
MAGADVQRANNAAKAAGIKFPDGRKPFHDWLTKHYGLEKDDQSFSWLKSKADDFTKEFPKYKDE